MGVAKVDHCNFVFNLVHCYFLRTAAHVPHPPVISSCTWALNMFSLTDVAFRLEYLCSAWALVNKIVHILTLSHPHITT